MFGEEKPLRLLLFATNFTQKSFVFINICSNYSVVFIYICIFIEHVILKNAILINRSKSFLTCLKGAFAGLKIVAALKNVDLYSFAPVISRCLLTDDNDVTRLTWLLSPCMEIIKI